MVLVFVLDCVGVDVWLRVKDTVTVLVNVGVKVVVGVKPLVAVGVGVKGFS